MSFHDALTQNTAPDHVGPVRFWYASGQLWAERTRPQRPSRGPELLLLFAVVAGLVGLSLLLLSPADDRAFLGAALLVALAGGACWAASRVQLRAGRHRFILDFASEALILERYSLGPGPARRQVIRFDDVLELSADRHPDGSLELLVRFRRGAGKTREEVLLPRMAAAHEEAFMRMWRLLQNAFGLGDAPPREETAPRSELPPDRFDPGS